MNLDFQDDFTRILTKIQESGLEYSEAKAKSWYAQEMCSSIKSSIMLKALSEDSKMPQVKAEMIARASEDYKKHLEETREAIRKENETRALYKYWECSFEAKRSLSSLEKRTQQLIDGE